MPSTIDHLKAIKRARDAGDVEAAQFITQQMVNESNPAERAALGAVYGVGNVAQNVGNIIGLVNDETIKKHEQIAKPLLETTAGKVGKFGGELLATAVPIGMGAGAVARGAGMAGRLMQGGITRGAVEGALGGAITAGPEERAKGALYGAVGGAAVPAAGATYRAARSGVRPTPAAQRLMREGVELTPGQMNPVGALGQIEEVSKSLPFAGPKIAEARQQSWKQAQDAIAQQVAPPNVTIKPGKNINESVANLSDAFNAAYSTVKGFPISKVAILNTTGPDVPLDKAFASAATGKTRSVITDEQRKATTKFLRDQLTAFRSGNVKSDDLIDVRSSIREARRDPGLSSAQDEILKKAEESVTQVLESHLPADVTSNLRAIDSQYGKFKIFENATVKAGERPEGFTPFQFSQAVKEATAKGEYAKGGGRLREMSKATADVFQTTQPPTGRQLATLLPMMLAGYGAVQNPVGGAIAATGLGGIYGTQLGRELAKGQTSGQLMARALERNIRRNVPAAARAKTSQAARMAAALEMSRRQREQEE